MKKNPFYFLCFFLLLFSNFSYSNISIINNSFVNHNYTVVQPDSFPGAGYNCDFRVEVQNFTTDIPINSVHLFVTYINTNYLEPDFVSSIPVGWELTDSVVIGNETTFRFTNNLLLPSFFNYAFRISTSSVAETSAINLINVRMDYVTAPGLGWSIVPLSLSGINITASIGDEPLPVDFVQFSGYLSEDNSKAQLNWTTSFEKNNLGFYIQKSTDGVSWDDIGFINSLSDNIFNASIYNYSFTDNNIDNKKNLYRLMQVDFDGIYSFSSIVEINVNYKFEADIFPNPASNYLTVKADKINQINIFDINGRNVSFVVLNQSDNIVNIDVSKLSTGTYTLLVSSNLSNFSKRISIVR